MRNIVRLVTVVIVAGLLISSAVYAASDKATSPTEQKKAAVIDVGNKMCPVTGDKVNGKDFYEYKGKRYGLCCAMCPAIFASDPEKYADIADKEYVNKK